MLLIFKGNDSPLSIAELLDSMRLNDRKNLKNTYINPAIERGLIIMTLPDKPNSKYQKYVLTEKGKKSVLFVQNK